MLNALIVAAQRTVEESRRLIANVKTLTKRE
jgi:hypothetical protein